MEAQLNETYITVTRTVYGFSEKERESKDIRSPYAVKSVRTIVTCDGETVYERKAAEHLFRKSYISPTLVDIFIDYISQLDQKAECCRDARDNICNGFHFRRHRWSEAFNFKKKSFWYGMKRTLQVLIAILLPHVAVVLQQKRIRKMEHHIYTSNGLWCIDQNPKSVSKSWIEQNAFQLWFNDTNSDPLCTG